MKSEVEIRKNINFLILKMMKKLNKLHINSEKILKDEELKVLKGGASVICYLKDYSVCYQGYTDDCELFYCTAQKPCDNENFAYGICTGW